MSRSKGCSQGFFATGPGLPDGPFQAIRRISGDDWLLPGELSVVFPRTICDHAREDGRIRRQGLRDCT